MIQEQSKNNLENLKEILKEAKFNGGEVFLSGDGHFVDCRGERMNPYNILIKIYKLREAVSRAHDFASLIDSQLEDE